MTLEPYIGNPNHALGGKVSGVQLYISTTLLSARGRWRGGSVEVGRTHIEIKGARIEPIRWKKLQRSHTGNP
jgi:hypothetical protein